MPTTSARDASAATRATAACRTSGSCACPTRSPPSRRWLIGTRRLHRGDGARRDRAERHEAGRRPRARHRIDRRRRLSRRWICSRRRGIRWPRSTGKPERHEWLRSLGAGEILTREDVTVDVTEAEPRHLMRARWAAAVDNVGALHARLLAAHGERLRQHRRLRPGRRQHVSRYADAVPAARRQHARHRFGTSADCGDVRRRGTRLATDLRPRHLDEIARRITMAELPDAIDEMLAGRVCGRLVVDVRRRNSQKQPTLHTCQGR